MKVLLVVNHPASSLDVIAQAIADCLGHHGIEVFCLYKTMFLDAIKTGDEFFRRIDVIHFILGVESFPYDIIEKSRNYCPIISQSHHCEFREMPQQFRFVDHLIYDSKSTGIALLSLGFPVNRMTLVNPGVDTSLFSPNQRKKQSNNGFWIGFFGTQPPNNCWDRKGSVLLVRAARIMVDKGYRPNFMIVGYGWLKLVADLRKMGLRVLYRINVPFHVLPGLYRTLDLYLITSLLEGGPLTLLEAGASNVPIISTPVGLSLEVLKQPGCGKLLNGFDSEEIADAVIDDIENREQSQIRANTVLEEIRQNWDWRSTYQNIHDIYHGVSTRSLGISHGNTTPRRAMPMPYLNPGRSARQQREIAMRYATVDLAMRLHSHGDRCAAWRTALPVLCKVHPLYWWRAFRAVDS